MNTMTDTPLVSIIAISYNHEKFARETLDSIISQDYPNTELIIIDDRSSDNSVEIIQNWIKENNVDCRLKVNPQNQGVTRNLELGLSAIQGDYYQVIACDDVLLPGKISSMMEEFIKLDADYALIHSNMSEIDGESKPIESGHLRNANKVPDGYVFEHELKENFIMTPTVIYRKSAVLEVGGYDTEIFFEDYDLFLRLSRRFKAKFWNNDGVAYRVLNTSMTRSRYKDILQGNNTSYWKLYNEAIDDGHKPAIKKRIREQTIELFFIRHDNSRVWIKKYLDNIGSDSYLRFLYFLEVSGLYRNYRRVKRKLKLNK